MKKLVSLALMLILLLSGCRANAPTAKQNVFKSAHQPSHSLNIPQIPAHSDLCIPNLPLEDVILYFNEVCLDSEFINSGDPSFVQKWTSPIYYTLEGSFTEEDVAVLESFCDWLNTVDGFPGIFQTDDASKRNLRICFCGSEDELIDIMGYDFYGCDGGVTFWYYDNEIYEAIVCYRADVPQHTRNSVIIEELYNGLGPVQDTDLREDSIIYSGFSEPQWLSEIDELLLRLLYHPDIKPGMNASECAAVISTLYY